jgi:hypothetical protein
MKTFRKLVTEISAYNVPVVSISTTGTDVHIPEIKNELNKNIDIVLKQEFYTVEEAIQKLSKILAMYSLDLPLVDINNEKSGSLSLDVGTKNSVWDEFDGEVENVKPFTLKFNYKLNDGLYKCSAELK